MKRAYSTNQYQGRSSSGRFVGAPVTKWLMIIIAAFFLLDVAGANPAGRFRPWLALEGATYEIWRWVTYSLVNIQVISWVFSLMILYSFGRIIEQSIGPRRFAIFVGYCILAGALVFTLMRLASSAGGPLTGASSMTIGLVVAAGLLYPEQRVQMMLPPMPVKLKNLALFIVATMVILSIAQQIDPAISLAHLSGVAVAYFCMRKVSLLDLGKPTKGKKKSQQRRPSPPRRPAKKKSGMKPRTLLKMSVSKREAEVNKILDKVSAEGIGNLTDEEKELLKFAAKND